MVKENILLDIPDFLPEYDENIDYGYKNTAGKNLEKLLRKTSKNHCMYCYALLKSDRNNTGNLEHSIEKSLDEKHLTECVPNIAIACQNCNQSLKRKGEKERLRSMEKAKKNFAKNLECKKKCKVECDNYKELKEEYCRISRIILQPFGVIGKKSNQKYYIQYDVYSGEFVPSTKYNYDKEDIEYIKHHINHFKLNDSQYRTKALVDFLEDVIEAEGKYKKEREYSNFIVDLFKEQISELSQDETLRLCEQIYEKKFICFEV